MTRDLLIPLILFYIALLSLLLGYILSGEFYKKRVSARKNKWLENAELLIRNAILPGEGDLTHLWPDKMEKLRNPRFRKFLLQHMMEARQHVTGPAANQLLQLYLELNMKQESRQKLKASRCREMAEGIHELAIMGQKDQLEEIFRLSNHENSEVRVKAQSAIIELAGFEGLSFLDIARHPISDWQQMKLLHQLSRVGDEKQLSGVERWLQSNNPSVVVFSLKIIRIYKLEQLHPLVFIHGLHHANQHIRTEALKTLKEACPEVTDTLIRAGLASKIEKSSALPETSDPPIFHSLDVIKEV